MPPALLVVGLAAAAGFGLLASHVLSGAADAFDRALTDTIHVHISYPLRVVLLAYSRLGAGDVMFVVTCILAIGCLVLRRRRLAALWAVTMGGGFVLTQLAKSFIARARPEYAEAFLVEDGSFPSGHTSMALIFSGFALYLFVRRAPPPIARTLATAAVIAWCLSMGATRFLLTNHYLTDVMGGYLLGVAWLAVVVGVIEGTRYGVRGTRGGTSGTLEEVRSREEVRADEV